MDANIVKLQEWKSMFQTYDKKQFKILAVNIGIKPKELEDIFDGKIECKRITDVVSRFVRYSPLTKQSILAKLSEDNMYNYIEFFGAAPMVKGNFASTLKNDEFVSGYCIPAIHHFPLVEIYSDEQNFGVLEERYFAEINSGFVRLSKQHQK